MICPSCGTTIRDGYLRCPACHADLTRTHQTASDEMRWCANCGVLLPQGVSVCPHCGLPQEEVEELSEEASVPVLHERSDIVEALDALEHDSFSVDETHAMARIESALPDMPDPYDAEAAADTLVHPRMTLLAAIAAVFVVGGTVLYITHPWNPRAYSISATEPADTSMAGFPGEVQSLSQDQTGTGNEQMGDEYIYNELIADLDHLRSLEELLAQSEALLRDKGLSGTQDERMQGSSHQAQIAVELSNLIASLDMLDVSESSYAEDVGNLRTLGNWLRNWSDALTAAWSVSSGLDTAQGHEDEILSSLRAASNSDGMNAYQALFDRYVDDWIPQPLS